MSIAPRAYSYVRFSTPEQMRGDSLRRQTEKAEVYAAANGLVLDSDLTFRDLGTSAFRGRNSDTGRLGDFLGAVRGGLVAKGSYLLVENLDRISRQTARKALRVLEDILVEDIAVVTLDDGKVYTEQVLDSDPLALMMALLIFVRSNEESARKSERLKAAWSSKRQRAGNQPLTARVPGWLRLDKQSRQLVVVEERAEVVRRIFKLAVAGYGLERIAQTLNGEGVRPFGKAKFWHRSYVSKIIENSAAIGTLIPHSLEYAKDTTGRLRRVRRPLDAISGYYPPVVHDEIFQQVRGMRENRAPSTRTSSLQNILACLALCPVCSGPMTRVTKGSRVKAGKPYLVCSRAKVGAGCTYLTVPYGLVEATLKKSLPMLRVPLDIVAKASSVAAGKSLMKVQGKIRDLAELLVETPSSALREQLMDLEQEEAETRAEVKKQLDRPKRVVLMRTLSQLKQAPEMDPARINALLRQAFHSVVVDHGAQVLRLKWKNEEETELPLAEASNPPTRAVKRAVGSLAPD